MDLFEQKFVELNYTDNRPSHNGDAAKECEKLIRAEESKGWQAGQVLILSLIHISSRIPTRAGPTQSSSRTMAGMESIRKEVSPGMVIKPPVRCV